MPSSDPNESGERSGNRGSSRASDYRDRSEAGGGILGPTGEASLLRLDREDYNIRAAITWSLVYDHRALGLQMVSATWRWFHQSGRLREA